MTDLDFYGLDVLVMGAALLFLARVRRIGESRVRGVVARLHDATIRRESRLAMAFGIPLGWWLVLRGLVLSGAITAGILSRVPAGIAVAILAGLYGFPWSLEGLALNRRIAMAEALGKALEHTRTRLDTTGQSIDVVLRDVASRRQGQAARIFAPLATARDVDMALADSVARSGLPAAEDSYMTLAVARTRPPQVLGSVITEVQVPDIASTVGFMRQEREWIVGERAQALLLAGLTFLAYWATDQMPKVHAFHASPVGQATLIVAAVVFALALYGTSRMHRSLESGGWDTVTAHRELENLRRG